MGSYLKKVGGIYYFRRRIPLEFRESLGLKELFRSLHTSNFGFAKALAAKVHADLELAFFSSRMGTPPREAFRKVLRVREAPLQTPPELRNCSTLFQDFRQEMLNSRRWNPKTDFENSTCFRRFSQWANDPPVSQVSHSMLLEFRRALGDPYFSSPRKGPGPGSPLSPGRINRHLTVLTAFFGWLVRHEFLSHSPAQHLLLPKGKLREFEERHRYSEEEVRLIMREVGAFRKSHPERFWVPMIAIFSGMRLNEICQLYVRDVREIIQVWCFDINNATADKAVKNPSSVRIVPIHPTVLALGLLAYADSIFQIGDERLFPNLRRHKKNGYAHQVGQWFQKFNRERISQDPRKTFHSLRHTFIDTLKQLQIEPSIIAELAGHSTGSSITLSRYGKRFSPSILLEAISKVSFSEP